MNKVGLIQDVCDLRFAASCTLREGERFVLHAIDDKM